MQSLHQLLASKMTHLQSAVTVAFPRSLEEAQALYNELQAIECGFKNYAGQCNEVGYAVPTFRVQEYSNLRFHLLESMITAEFPKCFDRDSDTTTSVKFRIWVKSNGQLAVQTAYY